MKTILRLNKFFLLSIDVFFYCANVSAQINNKHFCATMEMDSLRRAQNPGIGSLEDFENWLQQEIQKNNYTVSTQSAPVLTIPVIVHVIHNGEAVGSGSNISAAQVYSQITVFNQDFRRRNADTGSTPSVFKSVAADFEIEFCLAQINPSGNQLSEPGINRINRNALGFTAPPHTRNYTDLTIKPATFWDPKKYMNIWVLDLSGGIAGYGQFPDSSGLSGAGYTPNASAQTDGITMYYRCFGTTGNVLAAYNKGRSATHEAGHWLGLRHIWGDASCGNDHCNDTPTQQTYYTGCPSFPQITCSNGPNGAMFTNFMDYTSDGCKNIFTADQKTRARTAMQVSPRRKELPLSTVCIAPVVSNFSVSATQVCQGNSLSFTDQSINTPTSWSWSFQGGTPSTSTLQNPTVTYNNTGVFSVTLTATNINGGTQEIKTGYIQINAKPSITIINDTAICKGDTLQLFSSGGVSYVWSPSTGLNNNTISNPLFTGTSSTTYSLQVAGSNGCSSTQTLSVTVHSLTTPTITTQGAVLTCTPAASSYQWYRNDTLISGATAQTYSITINGNYKVKIINSNGCASETPVVITNVGIGEYNNMISNNIFIYPNPSNGEFTIKANHSLIITSVEIINILGQTVYFTTHVSGEHPIRISEKGLYILKLNIQGTNEPFSRKIIID